MIILTSPPRNQKKEREREKKARGVSDSMQVRDSEAKTEVVCVHSLSHVLPFFFFCRGTEPPHFWGGFSFFPRTDRYGFDCMDSLVWMDEWMNVDGFWVGLGCEGRENKGIEEKKRERVQRRMDGWMD